eukprot:TRINITY_DN17813_c0_g1_i1.p1 TRINITY_DN17813_c0_g1~~TRINITY_DN17813_c0_g1_i1.p1  ORF type:complete len:252 (-),score=24.65 TRINITY_DN17813_c0_g1_i1:41-796(-)
MGLRKNKVFPWKLRTRLKKIDLLSDEDGGPVKKHAKCNTATSNAVGSTKTAVNTHKRPREDEPTSVTPAKPSKLPRPSVAPAISSPPPLMELKNEARPTTPSFSSPAPVSHKPIMLFGKVVQVPVKTEADAVDQFVRSEDEMTLRANRDSQLLLAWLQEHKLDKFFADLQKIRVVDMERLCLLEPEDISSLPGISMMDRKVFMKQIELLNAKRSEETTPARRTVMDETPQNASPAGLSLTVLVHYRSITSI